MELYGNLKPGGKIMNADFSERTYTAEVMKTGTNPADAIKAIGKLTTEPREEIETQDTDGRTVKIVHAFIATKHEFHRSPRFVVGADGKQFEIPRRDTVRGTECYLYDVFVAQCDKHIVIAVPFHELAEQFFIKVDRALAGTRTLYERMDITNMVIRLGTSGVKDMHPTESGETISLSVSRCHLAYADAENRVANLQQIRMTGANLGAAEEYQSLIRPVLAGPRKSAVIVTPIVLGFALSANNVKKSSATTDRHGNFKIWIAPGLRRLTRIFSLLSAIEEMKNVTFTTANIPILQSRAIRGAEE